MTAKRSSATRRAFTLLELMVVMGILLFLAALTAVYFPKFNASASVSTASERVVGALLIAKQRAKREQVPCGVRFIQEDGVWKLQYVMVPDPYATGRFVSKSGASGGPWTLTFSGVDFTAQYGTSGEEAYAVNIGDFVELYGDVPRAISSVGATTLVVGQDVVTTNVDVTPSANAPPNYRIHRGPRPLVGEQKVVLPSEVEVLLTIQGSATGVQGVPTRTVNSQPYYEIVFTPSGSVARLNTNVGSEVICFVLRDKNTPEVAARTIVTVVPNTGFLASHPWDLGTDPYSFCRDARTSGL